MMLQAARNWAWLPLVQAPFSRLAIASRTRFARSMADERMSVLAHSFALSSCRNLLSYAICYRLSKANGPS